jgi:hypothetical protein
MSRYAPRQCPVCSEKLALTRLGCRSCGTELSGDFEQCEFCALTIEDRETLRVFLASRGNMREVEKHLGVSYPTARARFDSLLGKLGVKAEARDPKVAVLERLARGEIDVDDAMTQMD